MSYKPYYSGGWQSGESGGTPLTPESLQHFDEGIKSAHRAGQPKNLLDNSDFRNPVNQRGETSYTGTNEKYTIDRWKTSGKVQVSNGWLAFTNNRETGEQILRQLVFPGVIANGKTYTAAMMLVDGTLCVGSGVAENEVFLVAFDTEDYCLQFAAMDNDFGEFHIVNKKPGKALRILWAALYEGEYTAETLPAYQPKGYAAELEACQLYLNQLEGNESLYATVLNGFVTNSGKDIIVSLPVKQMRIVTPTADLTGAVIIRGINGYIGPSSGDVVSVTAMRGNGLNHNLKINKLDGTAFVDIELNNTPVTVSLCVGTKLTLSAEL